MSAYEDLVHLLDGVRVYSDYLSARCLFHDDRSPSMLVFEDGWYQCMSCDARGRNEELFDVAVGRPQKTYEPDERQIPSYPRNPELLHNLALSCHHEIVEIPHMGYYWIERGVQESIKPCKLGHMNGWYTIPVFNENDRTKRIIFRAGPSIQNPIAKYYMTAGSPLLYIPRWDLLDQKMIFVTYGIIDAIAISQLGFAACSPTAGKKSLNHLQLRNLEIPEVIIVPDDGEELQAIEDQRVFGPRASVRILPYLEYGLKDPADFMQNGHEDILRRELEYGSKETVG